METYEDRVELVIQFINENDINYVRKILNLPIEYNKEKIIKFVRMYKYTHLNQHLIYFLSEKQNEKNNYKYK